MDTAFSWLRRAYWNMRTAMDEELARYELTAAHLDVLTALWKEDGLEQRVLQNRLGVTAAALTSNIDKLVAHHYVQRQLNTEDARVKQIFLTERGKAIREQLGSAAWEFDSRLLKDFTPGEAALLKEWLQRMVSNLEEKNTSNS